MQGKPGAFAPVDISRHRLICNGCNCRFRHGSRPEAGSASPAQHRNAGRARQASLFVATIWLLRNVKGTPPSPSHDGIAGSKPR